MLEQPDRNWQRLCRELVAYRELKTGKVMHRLNDVLTGARVEAVDDARIHLNSLNALNAATWPRGSSGPMNEVHR